jgi:hypothetical protein
MNHPKIHNDVKNQFQFLTALAATLSNFCNDLFFIRLSPEINWQILRG